MRALCSAVFALLVCLVFTTRAVSQAPNCDVTCTPNMGSPSYGGAVAARGEILNARGFGNPLAAKTLPLKVPRVATVIGSQSYNYVIPILSIPGRAGFDLNLSLYYNSRVWDVDNVNNTVTFNADRDFPSYGFRLDFGYVEKLGTGLQGSITVTLPDGSKHALVPTTSTIYDAADGTYLEYNTQTNALYFKNGTIIYYEGFPSQGASPTLFRPIQTRDTNGNCIFFAYLAGHDDLLQYIVDTGNRVIVFNYDQSSRLINIAQQVQVSPVDPTGVHTYATFTWGTKYGNGQPWNNFTGLTVNGAPDVNTPLNVITDCTYANGTGYHFTYGDWGIITRIENRSAAGTVRSYVSYNYPAANAGALTDAPSYTQQTVSPDGLDTNTSVWTYSVSKSGTGVVTSMTTTDPLGGSVISTLDPGTGLLTQAQAKDSSNTVLRTVGYTWIQSGNGTVPSKITTVNELGQVSFVQYAYDPFYGDVTDVYEYDFGSVLKRHTVITYQDNSAYHLLGLPIQILVKDGAGSTVSRTDMAYDAGTPSPNITGASSHDDAGHGPTFTTRGNLTLVKRYSNAAAGTGQITRNFTYDTLGNLRTAELDCCNSKTFNFSSGTQYSYPDSVVRGPSSGPQFTTGSTYNNDKGLTVSSTDENGQVTQYQYDSMNHTAAVLLPPQAGTVVQINTYFDDLATSPMVKTYTTNSGNTAVRLTTSDGLGHVLQVDNKDGSTVLSTTKSVYDKLWRRTQTSNPYAPNETPVYTTFAYDGLSRITRVTPPSAGYTQYAYSGNTVTITDPAGKTRKNYSDALGRLMEVDEPGWGDALPGHGPVTVSGSERSFQWDPCYDPDNLHPRHCPRTVWDTGTVYITINGRTDSTPYGSSDTASSVALNLKNAINNDSLASVTASVSGATIMLTAKTGGALTNYSVSSSSTSSDPTDFGTTGSFAGQPSPTTLADGVDATPASSPTLARPFVTTYGYDTLDNLTSVSLAATGLVNGVSSPGQSRSHVYDSLSRLTSVTTPESGTVTNFYDVNAIACASDPYVPCRVQDARGIVKTLTYDGVNRLTGVQYSDSTPSVSNTYDTGGAAAFALGRLTLSVHGANSQAFTYDNVGSVISANQSIDGVNYPVQYAYNLLGQLTAITYPSARVVTQGYDTIGRTASITSNGTTYLNNVSYNAAGETLGYTLGNQIQGAFSYNDHLQLASLRYFKTGLTPDPLNLGYDYTSAAQPNNNGQIQAIHYYTQPGVEDQNSSEAFAYDPWSRLSAAHTLNVSAGIAGTWSLTWGYDRLGNRLSQTLIGGNLNVYQPQFVIDQNTNRITNSGYTYDAAGNMTHDPAAAYAYDGENRLASVNGGAANYTYIGPLRIKKVIGSTTTRYIYAGTKPIAEYTNGTLSAENLYSGSQLLTVITPSNTIYYHHDHLSTRAMTDGSGTLVGRLGTLPFGDPWYGTGNTTKKKFATYEHDDESGLDYADFRYYQSAQGRFTASDPLAGDLTIPQSLNRYSYVLNDPVNLFDPLGLSWDVTTSNGNCTVTATYKYSEVQNSDGSWSNVVVLVDAHGWCFGTGGWGPPAPFTPGPSEIPGPGEPPKEEKKKAVKECIAAAQSRALHSLGKNIAYHAEETLKIARDGAMVGGIWGCGAGGLVGAGLADIEGFWYVQEAGAGAGCVGGAMVGVIEGGVIGFVGAGLVNGGIGMKDLIEISNRYDRDVEACKK